jgi:hypothetical protein
VEPHRTEQEVRRWSVALVHAAGYDPPSLARMGRERGAAGTDATVGQRQQRLAHSFHAWIEAFEHDTPQRVDRYGRARDCDVLHPT